MTPRTLKARTEKSARTIVAFCTPLLRVVAASDMARQLLRSGTAVDSNYGSARRARSHREFTARIGVVDDEAAESLGKAADSPDNPVGDNRIGDNPIGR